MSYSNLVLIIALALVGCTGHGKPENTVPKSKTSGQPALADAGQLDDAAAKPAGDEPGKNPGEPASSERDASSFDTGAAGSSPTPPGNSAAGSGGGAPAAGSFAAGGGAPATDSGGPTTPADLTAELFDPARLPRFDIELSDDAKSALEAAPDTYVSGTLRYEAITLANVGVRIKGEASLRKLTQKAAFKIKLDEFVSGQNLLGLKRLTLNNLVSDPSFIAERLAYQMYAAAELPAPRCNNALVYVNGDFYGVYAHVESEDKPFLRRWFSSDAGNLYEDAQTDFLPGSETVFDLETNETANDRTDLAKLIDVLAHARSESFLSDMGQALNTEHYLRFTALEAAVDQWDMYSYTLFEPNNFRLYHDPASDKFVFLPWGMDMSMKPFPFSTRQHIALFEVPRYEDAADGREAGGLIFRRCLESASCKARYVEIVREVLALYEATDLEGAAMHHYAQIRDYVYNEPRKELSNAAFDAGYQSVLQTIRTRAAAMRKELEP